MVLAAFFCCLSINAQTDVTGQTPQDQLTPEQQLQLQKQQEKTREAQLEEAKIDNANAIKAQKEKQ